MSSAYLAAELYGLGQLISHLKRFRVPAHQRDYSWGRNEVRQFLEDIVEAMDAESSDYFVGLIVLLAVDGEQATWEVLDGQQRLATTTLLLAGIRDWLVEKGLGDDAAQIEGEFLAVRRLGGQPTPRMMLNSTNRREFDDLVTVRESRGDLSALARGLPRGSSNRLLLDAALYIRKFVKDLASSAGRDLMTGADRLFQLASYVENRVRVVSLKLQSPDDAYVVFESLNYRGHELSALDLVKNHMFGLAGEDMQDTLNGHWDELSQHVDSSSADDFLRIFWTVRFGRVQKRVLFQKIREEYATPDLAIRLSEDLAASAHIYAALDDPTSDVWNDRTPEIRHLVQQLSILKSRQTRVVIFSAVQHFGDAELTRLLNALVALTVRYQTVGKRRTGALEIKCADAAYELWNANATVNEIVRDLGTIAPDDAEFEQDFAAYSEPSAGKLLLILSVLEAHMAGRPDFAIDLNEIAAIPVVSSDQWSELGDEVRSDPRWIANWALLPSGQVPDSIKADSRTRIDRIESRGTPLSIAVAEAHRTGAYGLLELSKLLARNAVACWRVV